METHLNSPYPNPVGSSPGAALASKGCVRATLVQSGHTEPKTTATRRSILIRLASSVLGAGVIGLTAACGENGGGNQNGAAEPAAPATDATEVAVVDNDFEPAAIEVEPGTAVTWHWQGDHPHNVVGDGFESDVQTVGTFAHVFDDPGTYDYRCTLHSGMDGTIIVKHQGG